MLRCVARLCRSLTRVELDSPAALRAAAFASAACASGSSLAWSAVSAATSALASCSACAISCILLRCAHHSEICPARVLYWPAEITAVCPSPPAVACTSYFFIAASRADNSCWIFPR